MISCRNRLTDDIDDSNYHSIARKFPDALPSDISAKKILQPKATKQTTLQGYIQSKKAEGKTDADVTEQPQGHKDNEDEVESPIETAQGQTGIESEGMDFTPHETPSKNPIQYPGFDQDAMIITPTPTQTAIDEPLHTDRDIRNPIGVDSHYKAPQVEDESEDEVEDPLPDPFQQPMNPSKASYSGSYFVKNPFRLLKGPPEDGTTTSTSKPNNNPAFRLQKPKTALQPVSTHDEDNADQQPVDPNSDKELMVPPVKKMVKPPVKKSKGRSQVPTEGTRKSGRLTGAHK